jgi:hypothetical protein
MEFPLLFALATLARVGILKTALVQRRLTLAVTDARELLAGILGGRLRRSPQPQDYDHH